MNIHTTDPKFRLSLSRSRWAALGAAVAVSLTGGGLLAASAAGPSAASSTVTIDPCRLIDTREGGEPIGANETVTFSAHGHCGVPASATALVTNVTAVDPTIRGFLTAFPADMPRPATSTLNWETGTTQIANQATIKLSADGKFSVFNLTGDTDLVVDVFGYLMPASAGATGATGARAFREHLEHPAHPERPAREGSTRRTRAAGPGGAAGHSRCSR